MLVLNNENNYPLTLSPKTAAGHDARVDGAPVWAIDGDAATLEVAADGLSAKILTADTGAEVKTAKLTVTADADLGDGVKPLTLEADIVVGPAQAESLAFVLGEGVPK